eukprot:10930970-Alexandrium_andersonii.AAC.1
MSLQFSCRVTDQPHSPAHPVRGLPPLHCHLAVEVKARACLLHVPNRASHAACGVIMPTSVLKVRTTS